MNHSYAEQRPPEVIAQLMMEPFTGVDGPQNVTASLAPFPSGVSNTVAGV